MSTPTAKERDHDKAASNSRRLVPDHVMASVLNPWYYAIRMRLRVEKGHRLTARDGYEVTTMFACIVNVHMHNCI